MAIRHGVPQAPKEAGFIIEATSRCRGGGTCTQWPDDAKGIIQATKKDAAASLLV
jgi:hypothetical protein